MRQGKPAGRASDRTAIVALAKLIAIDNSVEPALREAVTTLLERALQYDAKIAILDDYRPVAEDRLSMQALIDWVPDYLWVKDCESRFVIVNKALAAHSGWSDPTQMVGMTDFDIHEHEVARGFRAIEQGILESGQPMIDREERIVDATGVERWLLSTKVPLRNQQNKIFGLVGIARDITARRQAEALRDSQAGIVEMIARGEPLERVLDALLRLLESHVPGAFGSIMLLDKDGEHLRIGAAPSLVIEYTMVIEGTRIDLAAAGSGIVTIVDGQQASTVDHIASDPLWTDYNDLASDYGYHLCQWAPISSRQGNVVGLFALYFADKRRPTNAEIRLIKAVTRIASIAISNEAAERQVSFLAHHDALTGLPNRIVLVDRLAQALLQAKRTGRLAAVIFADLDNFKLINDSLGHAAGDELLKAVAARMSQSVRACDTVARLGGDEFVLLLADQEDNPGLISVTVERIREAIAEPLLVLGQTLHITCSMGIATFPHDGESAQELMRNADVAMYQAKGAGRDNLQFFTDAMNLKTRDRLSMREDMRAGIERSEFFLLYQPQVDLRAEKVFAVEALVRWQHPTLGLVSPADFIPLAEETGLIVPLGDWILREACRQNKAWQDAGFTPINVCVNVSARQFADKTWVDRVASALSTSGLEAKYLELELTESLLMHDVDRAIETMRALQGLGVQFAIDDFGTGYSSLSALKNFPVARLKIDQSFVRNLENDENDRGIASAVISLGQKLHMRVIAEGVETEEQLAFLRSNQCDEIQGYHFSKPIRPNAVEAYLTKTAPLAESA